MDATQLDLNDVATFVRVVAVGTLAAAARELGVTKSTVSRRIARLEDQMGVSLVVRGPRGLTPTDAGAELFARSREALRMLAEAGDGVGAAGPRGVLRVTGPHELGTSDLFLDVLGRYRAACPAVRVDVDLTSRVVDVIAEGYDVAFRPMSAVTDTDTLIMRRLPTGSGGGVFASPAYLERHGRPRTTKELERHDAVSLAAFGDAWRLRRGEEERLVRPRVVVTAHDLAFLTPAAVAGLGVALVPEMFAESQVRRGELVRLLPRWSTALVDVAVVWPRTRHESPRIRAFLDLLPARLDVLHRAG